MKGVKKCFSFFFTLLVVSLVSCLVASSDSSALKYAVDTIPFYVPINQTANPNYYYDVPGFSIIASDDFPNIKRQYVASMATSNGECSIVNYREFPYIINHSSDDLVTINYGFSGLWLSALPSNYSSYDSCLSMGQINPFPSVPNLSLDYGDSAFQVRSNAPYRYKISGLTRERQDELGNDELFYLSKIFLDRDGEHSSFNLPSLITDLYIPLGSGGLNASSTFTNGMPIDISGSFSYYSGGTIYDINPVILSSNSTVTLETYYFSSSFYSNDLTSCSTSYDSWIADDDVPGGDFSYFCSSSLRSASSGINSYDPSSEIVYFRLHIHLDYDSDDTDFGDFFFKSSFIVTDNDYTDGGSFDFPISGSNPDYSFTPGNYTPPSDSNFLNSLINLFSFNFFNPFAPIFNMFTAGNTCADIPILAGMLHSEETQVCSWFDSSTRNILTPVIGLAAIMLLFGFIVRWLGSSSGNMFEDQTSHKWGNTQIKSKGGK